METVEICGERFTKAPNKFPEFSACFGCCFDCRDLFGDSYIETKEKCLKAPDCLGVIFVKVETKE